ncbi:hypothetical protein DZB84_16270 [Bacillus sp. HNG]|uniref:coiled-coil domain-containing protein n=1 Tax=Bacillus sp. HNG TaxID=2293325 RepID=UPI000E2EBCE4|nr:hypothetical protein [Bacillus sp. HNG]RFB13527.1 hypothetical protein DZB84_16270 [Bacillus sp. HNG]
MKNFRGKNVVLAGFVLLIAITILAVMREQEIKDDYHELQDNNEKLVEQIDTLEKEVESLSRSSNDLETGNKQLTEEIVKLEEAVEALKTPVHYQDFLEAIKLVESYKEAKTFKEASEFIALQNGFGLMAQDSSLTCPCLFAFNSKSVEWIPNAVLELVKVRTEKDKIILTYNTVNDIGDYEFVLIKGMGRNDPTEKWRIEEIKHESKKS